MTSVYDFSARTNDGSTVSLDQYRGRALLIVNTASKCGFTGQYAALEALQRRFGEHGFCVLGFPCNQFGGQEPGDAQEIASFCSTRFDVTFPVFDKIEVNGRARHPLFAWLAKQKPGLLGSGAIKWNFTKFLTDRDGQVVSRYAPQTQPEALVADIEKLI